MEGRSLDYVIIAVYLIGIAVFGIISGGRQSSVKDYFLGSKAIPWWAICFSIVAAETSTLTFISIPGLSYLTNLNFLQVTFGYLLGRIIVAAFFLPAYYKGELKTAYTYLENRFGSKTRNYASIVFLLTRTAADGVRLFATAIPLKLLLNINYPAAIVIIAVVSLAYTYTGGIKGIIWADVIQMFIYIFGALLAGIFILKLLPQGWDSVMLDASGGNKFQVFNLGFSGTIKNFFNDPYTLIGGILGGTFLSMASHGTDQLIVQKLLAAKNLKESKKAVIGSGVIVILQFVLFLLLGVMLYAYYGRIELKPDEIFPYFIIHALPPGVSGIIIAGLFAAAMSTLAASMSSLSSSTMMDLFQPVFGSKGKELFIPRIITLFWAAILVLSALFFMNTSTAVVELALSIASFTYGGLLGTFLLGLFIRKAQETNALVGFTLGIIVMIFVISFKLVAWTWYTIIGVAVTLLSGYLTSFITTKQIRDYK
ncbi:MAG TPA: sodium:solute symporter [Ignavibacteriaceae bacterium]